MAKTTAYKAASATGAPTAASDPGLANDHQLASAPESPRLPLPRGPVSAALVNVLTGRTPPWTIETLGTEAVYAAREVPDILFDEDLQLVLFILYGLHHTGFIEVDDAWEWHPGLFKARAEIEVAFEARLRRGVGPAPDSDPTAATVVTGLFQLIDQSNEPGVPDYLMYRAGLEQAKEFLVHHCTQQATGTSLWTWTLGRLDEGFHCFLPELGVSEHDNVRSHQGLGLLAGTLDEAALAPDFTAYIEHLPAITLASANLISFFGLHRRMHGAFLGHLAVCELASAVPSAKYSRGLRRLGFGDRACAYFDDQVETDAAHEQATGTGLTEALGRSRPQAREEVLFGAAASCLIGGLLATWQLQAWSRQQTSLRQPLEPSTTTSRT